MDIELIDICSQMEDFVFAFQYYKIKNEADYEAARKDFDLSAAIIQEISMVKEAVLALIQNKKQNQIAELSFEFMMQTTLKYQLHLSTELVAYSQDNNISPA